MRTVYTHYIAIVAERINAKFTRFVSIQILRLLEDSSTDAFLKKEGDRDFI